MCFLEMDTLYYIRDDVIDSIAKDYIQSVIDNFEYVNGHRYIDSNYAAKQGTKLFFSDCNLGWIPEFRNRKFSRELKKHILKRFVVMGETFFNLSTIKNKIL